MMILSRRTLAVTFGLLIPVLFLPASQAETPPAPTGPPAITLSLADAVKMGLENNLDIKVAKQTPLIREQDIIFQEAVFDPNFGATAFKSDNSQPSQNVFDIGTSGSIVSLDSTVTDYAAGWGDRMRWGGSYTADLRLTRFTSTSRNAVFPTSYQTSFEVAYNQALLRNFGTKANETNIVIAQNNQAISRSQFRQQVLDVLKATEDAYWELVFARQDLDVKGEALALAQELLKLNKIKVQVGTLPPIEITTAEAEVANREQGVIVAENAVRDAEDRLRSVLNMPKQDDSWSRPIAPLDTPTYVERAVDLPAELEKAISSRPDLEQARLSTSTADARVMFDRNQLKWDLNVRAAYMLRGLAGDAGSQPLFPVFCDDNGLFDPNTMTIVGGTSGNGRCDGGELPNPTYPLGLVGENQTFAFSQTQNDNFLDSLYQIRDTDFESWSLSLALGIPIGNRSAEASYMGSRLAKEQSNIIYERAKLNAEVQVRTAARAILTNKKRIDAAEKNVELQRKKVEAEQKKFENGMSTSFQVLEFQEDLTTALGTKNRSLVDYRKSLTALEQAKGTLDQYLKVTVQ